jgi:L-asparaginase/Glu-tRNA(Gln) amidotransferase subunit D
MVIAVSGSGVIDNAARAVALKIAKQGIPVVISIRHPSGFSVPFLRDDPL